MRGTCEKRPELLARALRTGRRKGNGRSSMAVSPRVERDASGVGDMRSQGVMMFRKVAPMLLVEDVDRVVRFYREVSGAKLSASLPETPPFEWASLELGEVELMFWDKEAARKEYPGLVIPENPASFIAYIYVDDVDVLYERVKGMAEVLMAPVDQFYGIREFTIRDPFGFILTFAQEKAS